MKKIFGRAMLVSLLWIIISVKDTELTGLLGATIIALFLVIGVAYIWCGEIKEDSNTRDDEKESD